MLYINGIVSRPKGSSYGVITGIDGHYGTADNFKCKVTVHHIDPKTGKPMVCPDARCDSKRASCPIHQYTTNATELTTWNPTDIAFYAGNGMLATEVAKAATEVVVRITRKGSHKFTAEAASMGMVVARKTLQPGDGTDLWQDAVALTNVRDDINAPVTIKEGHEDYAPLLAHILA